MQKLQILVAAGENAVEIRDHPRGGGGALEHALLRAPDIAGLHGLEFRHQRALREQRIEDSIWIVTVESAELLSGRSVKAVSPPASSIMRVT